MTGCPKSHELFYFSLDCRNTKLSRISASMR